LLYNYLLTLKLITMKKQVTLLALLLAFSQVNAQCNYRMNFNYNMASANINVNGFFFRDMANGLPTYRPANLSALTTIFQTSFSISGKDMNGQDHMSVITYDGSDFSCGPVATNYSDQNYTANLSNRIWSVYKFEVDQHIQNWNTPSYVVPPSVQLWPGNGDVSNGMPSKLAPYTDLNGNGIYDPENGDYPDIMGDQALFMVMNDQNNSEFPSTSPMNIELHYMFYQFVSGNPLDNTTFANVKVYNRSTATYSDVKFNVFNDFDLGNYNDDYCGVDVSRDLVYVYNGDNNDEANAGRPGYGINPPAMGMVSLNHTLTSSVFPGNVIMPNPNGEFLNVINGKNPNRTDVMNSGTPTPFQFSDTLNTGYNEVVLGNTPGDRRTFSSVSLGTLAPNSVKCMDFAWVFAHKTTGTSLFKSVDSLMKVADFVKDFYNNTNYCTDGTLQTQDSQVGKFEIYPNPSNGEITCIADQELELVEVLNMEGRLIHTVQVSGKEVHLDLSNFATGAYLIKLSTSKETQVMPFHKQ
jgi:hypothetical protein